MRVRGSCKLPEGRDWLSGKLSLALVGKTMLGKSLTQLSADGWGCVPSLLALWLKANPGVYKLYGRATICLVPQLCLSLCDLVDCSQPGSSVHGDSPGKNAEVGCHALLQVGDLQKVFMSTHASQDCFCQSPVPQHSTSNPRLLLLWRPSDAHRQVWLSLS